MLQKKYSKPALTRTDINIMVDTLMFTVQGLIEDDKSDPRIDTLNGIMTKLLKMRDSK